MQVSETKGMAGQGMEEGQQVFPTGMMTLFVLVTVLFFLWGMSNNLTDILVQQFKKSFELSQFSAQLVQFANFMGYFCMAIPAALAHGMVTSAGCIGNRVYTGIGDGELYAALPGRALELVAQELQTIASANQTLEQYHRGRQQQLSTA